MELLKNKIRQEGSVLNNSILKVDSFLNHQIDPFFMFKMGEEFARRFANCGATRILTIEASGIAIALATGYVMNLPLVFARKRKSVLMTEDAYTSEVFSFTKQESSTITVLKKFLPAGENVLIIDDFLANGEAALGLAGIVEQAGSRVAGIGIVIEKSFQPGADKLRKANYHLESLARIRAFENGEVSFMD
jgi:xanthine phosphoribosyltransferase